MRILKKISIKVKTDLKALDQVLFQFNRINQPSIPKKDWLQCQLALAEGFTNAVRHAHKGLSDDVPIEIEAILTEYGMEICILDYGSPFDLDGFIQKIVRGENNQSEGGRGIPILHKISDRLSYLRTNDARNCLLIVKHFSKEKDNFTYE